MKKIISFILTIVMSVSVFTLFGCNDNGYDGPVTELKVLNFRVEDKNFYKWLNKEFEKENPDIKITYEAVDTANYQTLLSARLNAGEVDVFGS